MSKPWWAIIPSPLEGLDGSTSALPNIEHLPIVTRKGRVVYNRRPHKFTYRDALRVACAVGNSDRGKPDGIMSALKELTIFMIEEILSLAHIKGLPAQFTADLLYEYVHAILTRFFDEFPEAIRNQADEFLADPYGL